MSTLSRAHLIATAGSVALAATCSRALGAERIDPADVKALDASAALERAAGKTYADAAAANVLTPPVATVLARFQGDHASALAALTSAVSQAGQTVTSDVAPTGSETFSSEAAVLAYVYALERTIAFAYVQSVGQYKSRDFAMLAASIAGATTTHVALLAEALRRGPAYPSGLVSS